MFLKTASLHAIILLQVEGALAADALQLFPHAMLSILSYDLHSFDEIKKSGVSYHVGTDGISCNTSETTPWRNGREVIDALKKVSDLSLMILHRVTIMQIPPRWLLMA